MYQLFSKYCSAAWKRKFIFSLMIFGMVCFSKIHAQYLGMEWINYSQQYYKFPITQKGIYHIDSLTLATAGINVSSFDARNLQIFYHAEQIPLYIQGESDGVLNGTDFIEFYAEPNDGWFDSTLYVNGLADMLNPAYSLFNDTSVYYLTWNSSISNLRFSPETDTDFSSYTAASYYLYKVEEKGPSFSYSDGEILSAGLLIPEYSEGEGFANVVSWGTNYAPAWTSPALNGLQGTIYNGVNASLQLRVGTCNNPTSTHPSLNNHHHQFRVADNLVLEDSLTGYEFHVRNFSINSGALSTSTEPFRFTAINDLTASQIRTSYGYYRLVMPQIFSMNNRSEQHLLLPDDISQPKSRLDITNFNILSSTARLYDLTNNKRITVVDNAGTLQALVPNDGSPQAKKLYLYSDATVLNVAQLRPVSTDPTHFAQFRDFTSGALADKDYVIITHPSLLSSVTNYSNYRASTGYNPVVIDMDEIYDQFGFGIRKHPGAIRNFLKMTNGLWTTKPEHLFLIGKGVITGSSRNNATNYSKNLVPAIGNTGSDNLYSYNIAGDDFMYTAIGRLAAQNNTDVTDYLNKVMEYETWQNVSPTPLWQKNIVHMASDPSFQGYIDGYKTIIEDTLFGGHVSTFVKNGIAPFPINTSDSIRTLFNDEGVSLATVFGHSSGTGFDLTVDEPEQMQNSGKYPWYVVNGCLSGDLFQPDTLVSERYVLTPNKGAIGFIASTGVGLASILPEITGDLYRNISIDNYYQTMGIAHKEAINENVWGWPYYGLIKVNALNFQIHGDPGIKFNSDSLPDIDLQVANVSFESQLGTPVVTTEMDSFKIRIILFNLGKSISQPYAVDIVRDFPQPGVPNITVHIDRPNGINYSDTVEYYFPISLANSFGLNQFNITTDIPSIHIETNDYSNNQITVGLNITTTDIIPVYPHKFAVIPTNHTPLKASTGDPFAPMNTYRFQIDTTDLFNSPFLRETTISQSGGVVQWDPGVLLDTTVCDSCVYFWRVGVDSLGSGSRWRESTFQHIQGKYGWGQDHFFQFKEDDFTFIDYNRPARRFDFVPVNKELKIINYPERPVGDTYNFSTQFTIDAGLQEASGCLAGSSSMYVVVIDPVTLLPWGTNYGGANPDHNFGNIMGCRSRVEDYFWFNLASAASTDSLIDMIRNDVPDDYFIGMYTFTWYPWALPNFATYSDSLVAQLTSMGADSLATLKANAHQGGYIFYTQKGNPSSTMEAVGFGTSPIQLNAQLETNWNYGFVETDLIGPASEWKSFHWQQRSLDADTSNDEEWVRIIGVDTSGNETILMDEIPSYTTDIYGLNLLPQFNASIYPYLKLFFFTRDDSTVTPSQMNHWHVMYEGVPECALDPNVHYYFDGDTSYQGENVNMRIAIRNIGDYDMDSLQVRYAITDANNTVHNYYHMKPPLLIGDTIIDTFTVANANFVGMNNFYIEANPFTSIHQIEQYHFNNIASRSMMVDGDNLNPLLDVTFDGIHIMDRDIVSAKPFVNIQLKDENVLRLIDDTADFDLYIKYPGQSMATKVYFSNPWVTFIPASNAENYAKIEMKPDFTSADGMYELLLRAQDKSGNESGYGDSGIYDYKIRFEVVNQATITHIFNYPNPFSTSTQWVFTLTGSEVPTEFTIRIMTISGVVVREITLDELGPIHIGDNVTSFKWNGTDEYGDKLATGVYIYQVITKLNGEDIDHRSTSADKYFKNNFGKLYILR